MKKLILILLVLVSFCVKSQDIIIIETNNAGKYHEYSENPEIYMIKSIIRNLKSLNDTNLIWVTNTLEILSKDKYISKEEKISVLNNSVFTLEKFNNNSLNNIILNLKAIVKNI